MSTVRPAPPATFSGAGFVGALRAELLKIAKRWAPWVILLVAVVITLGLSYFLTWLIVEHVEASRIPARTAKAALAAIYPGGLVGSAIGGQLTPLLAVVYGALITGNDFGGGALKTLFTLRPGRLEAVAAKVVALAASVLVGVLVVFAVCAGASVLFGALDGASLSIWPSALEIVKGVLGGWLILGWWALFGMVLDVLFQNMALAIGIGLAYQVVIESLLLNIGSAFKVQFFVDLKRALPGPNANWLVAAFPVHQASGTASTAVASGANNAGQATLILAGWCALALIVAGVVVARRDVT